MYMELMESIRNYSATTVRAISDALNIPQEEVLDILKDACVEIGMLPDKKETVNCLLNKCFFFKQTPSAMKIINDNLVSYMNANCPHDAIAIVHYGFDYAICRYKPQINSFFIENKKFYDVKNIYIRWPDKENHTHNARKVSKRRGRQKTTYKPQTYSYNYYQPNPNEYNVGDCVLRAFSAAVDISWEESMEKLLSYGSTIVNVDPNFDRALRGEGFIEVTSKFLKNKSMTVEQFCILLNEKQSRRRYFITVYSHAIAILPTKCEDGIYRYKIQDTWNSTQKKIKRIWAKGTDEDERSWEVRSRMKREREEAHKPIEFSVGDKIVHPDFGIGEITEQTSDKKICTITFSDGNIKKLSSVWIKNKCEKA